MRNFADVIKNRKIAKDIAINEHYQLSKKITEFTSDTEQENPTRDKNADIINCLEVLFKEEKYFILFSKAKQVLLLSAN